MTLKQFREGMEERFDKEFKNVVRAEYNDRDRMHKPVMPSDPREEIKSFYASEFKQFVEGVEKEIKKLRNKSSDDLYHHIENKYHEESIREAGKIEGFDSVLSVLEDKE